MKLRYAWLALIVVLALGMAAPGSPPKAKTLIVVNFDVEDYTTPASVGIDEIPKWLAEIMTEEGVTGTFNVIGEKARSLEKRGRRDVIAAMAKHDIGSHTNFGSIHPTVTEELEKADWAGGVRHMLDQESAGFKDLERIFDVPVTTLARHGGSYGPQLVCALGKIGKGFTGCPVGLPGQDVAWFCGALCQSYQYGGYDDFFYRDDLFEPAFAKLKAEFPEVVRTHEAISFFIGHPTKIRTEQFWDFNYYAGKNPPPSEWKTPPLRPLETMKTAQKNFRRLMQYLKSRNDIETTTFRAMMDRYARQKGSMAAAELREIAEKTLKEGKLSAGRDFSPAEAFAGLAVSIASFGKKGALPRELEAAHPLGPVEMPDARPGIPRVALKDVYELAAKADAHIRQTGMLPAFLEIGKARIGTGSLFALFSAVYLDASSKGPKTQYEIPGFDPYPKANEAEIIKKIEGYRTWPVHRPDLDMSKIVEFTKLQLWTLKPAHRIN